MKVQLLGKTELWIENIVLRDANLTEIGNAMADVLKLGREEIFVTDASENHVALDILRTEVEAENVYGKKNEILERLASIQGVSLTDSTMIHSEGILGFISLDEGTARDVLSRTDSMVSEIVGKLRMRCMVFPTGEEVRMNLIRDTNSPYIEERLEEEGYEVKIGPALKDDIDSIFGALNNALDEGYGLVITTGGVGAESKDRTVEALLRLDPTAATPYITKYHKGTGRHEKEGVRIAVGALGPSLFVALPGPNDEVRLGLKALISGLSRGLDKHDLALEIANALRSKYVGAHGLSGGA